MGPRLLPRFSAAAASTLGEGHRFTIVKSPLSATPGNEFASKWNQLDGEPIRPQEWDMHRESLQTGFRLRPVFLLPSNIRIDYVFSAGTDRR
jgi:hypothetical protein